MRIKTKRNFSPYIILSVIILVIIFFCIEWNSDKKPKIVFAHSSYINSFDPNEISDENSKRVFSKIYSTLFLLDENGKIIPSVAKEYSITSPNVLMIKLFENIKFHDETTLSALDIKFSLDRLKIPEIKEISVINHDMIQIIFEGDIKNLLNILTLPKAYILSEKIYKEKGDKYFDEPIGTGEYFFVKKSDNGDIILRKNLEYFGAKGKYEIIEYRNLSDEGDRIIGLETGDIDVAYDIPVFKKEQILKNSNLKFQDNLKPTKVFLGFNVNKSPFNNLKVAQALAYAVDTVPLEEIIYKKDGLLDLPKKRKYPYDFMKAVSLLFETGYQEGFSGVFLVNGKSVNYNIALLLKEELKAYGINIQIDGAESNKEFLRKIKNGQYDFFISTTDEMDINSITNPNLEPDHVQFIELFLVKQGVAYNKRIENLN
ncbi:MAG: ABC transporter substrate-binding protein [Fusobacteriaceae bacterium]